jgi:hypothetical protein
VLERGGAVIFVFPTGRNWRWWLVGMEGWILLDIHIHIHTHTHKHGLLAFIIRLSRLVLSCLCLL